MQIHNLSRRVKNKKSVQVGRGGKRGKTSGRGTKGQKARAGHKIRPEMRDAIKKIPKLRGYLFGPILKRIIVTVNLKELESKFSSGEKVTPMTLIEKKLIKKSFARSFVAKILGKGEITKKLTVSGCEISKSAKDAIIAAGGKVEDKI